MNTCFFIDTFITLTVLVTVILFSKAGAYYAAPFTIYGGSALIDSSHVSLGFLFFYGFSVFAFRLLIGIGLTLFRKWFSPDPTSLELLLLLIIPNLGFYLLITLQSFLYVHPQNNLNYLAQLGIFIEYTLPLIIGSLLVKTL